jgi:hypothetical protein
MLIHKDSLQRLQFVSLRWEEKPQELGHTPLQVALLKANQTSVMSDILG